MSNTPREINTLIQEQSMTVEEAVAKKEAHLELQKLRESGQIKQAAAQIRKK